MKILNFGSLNIDYVYQVNHFVGKGETLGSQQLDIYPGGKGLNQSVALSLAGADVYHAGLVGKDGQMLVATLEEVGVNTDHIKTVDKASGHAIIQVDQLGDNCILLYPGANKNLKIKDIDMVFSHFNPGDLLLLQNEVNHIGYMIEKAKSKGMVVAFNPAPFDDSVTDLPLELVDIMILNETEGLSISKQMKAKDMIDSIIKSYKDIKVVLTLGADGVMYGCQSIRHSLKPSRIFDPVDTTAAGDTFIGYFLSELMKGNKILTALTMARNASEICIMKSGASVSIPKYSEVIGTLQSHNL